jgi:uncharacterized protein (DUF58 family)
VGLAAGLAYVGLRQSNPVRAILLGEGAASRISPLLRHVQRLPDLLAFLAGSEARGATRLTDGIDAYLRSTQLPGTAIVLSDFLIEPHLYENALSGLRARGYHVVVVRVIGPQERDPAALPRQVRLRDAETGAARLIDLTPAHRARYARAVEDHLTQLTRWCATRAIACATADTAGGIEACLLADLPRAGVLQ